MLVRPRGERAMRALNPWNPRSSPPARISRWYTIRTGFGSLRSCPDMDTRNSAFPGILILSGVRGDTRRYRTLHLYQQLQLAGLACQLSHITDPHLPELAPKAAVVILHRVSYDLYVEDLIQGVHARGGLV